MDARRRDRIKAELKKAEDYLQSAEILHKNRLYTPCVTMSFYAAFHAAAAAYLTAGIGDQKETFVHFITMLERFNGKLDPFLDRLKESREEWGLNAAFEYPENEAHLRIYQTREFFLEIKDFLRRLVAR